MWSSSKKKPMGSGKGGGGVWGRGTAWGGELALSASWDKSAELLCVSARAAAGACGGGVDSGIGAKGAADAAEAGRAEAVFHVARGVFGARDKHWQGSVF